MVKEKVLKKIEPFNDIWYKDCSFHALFPVINHFGRSIIPFLLKNTHLFRFDIKTKGFFLEEINFDSREQILRAMGIIEEPKFVSNEIINDIKTSIVNDRPVAIYIDQFYESIRLDTYQKHHWSHMLLCYGFNECKQCINILEHNYRDNFLFENRILSYDVIKECYEGFVKMFVKDTQFPTIFEYYPDSSYENYTDDKNSHILKFANNMINNKDALFDSLEQLKQFCEYFKQIEIRELITKENVDTVIDNVCTITSSKEIDRYRILKVFGNQEEFVEIIEYLISDWNFIRAVISRYRFTNDFCVEHFSQILNKLDEICQLEKMYCEGLFKMLSNWRRLNE